MRWLIVVLVACTGEAPTDEVCATMCQELVQTCEYDAYPSYESCMQGCAYELEQGGKIEPQSQCIVKAECDAFEIVDCQHRYGAEEQ